MKAKSSERQERLARALRENLTRRKSRDRALAGKPPSQPEPRPNKAQKGD
jgi:hypothetical protein